MTITLTRTRLAALAGLAVAAFAGAGFAAIPSSSGTISACKDTKGSLKVIDAESGQSCNSSQQLLQWNVQGPQGPAGPQGSAGGATAYARVLPPEAGNVPLRVDAERSSNVTVANVAHPAVGRYCFGGLPFTPRSVTATVGLSVGLDEPTTPAFVRADVTGVNNCPEGFKQAVAIVTTPALSPRDADIYIVFN